MERIGIGLHIGGKGVKSGAVNLSTGHIYPNSVFEAKVDKNASARHITTLWAMQVNKTISTVDDSKVIGIGVSTPGPFDYVQGIASYKGLSKYESLDGLNVTVEIVKRLKSRQDLKVRYINDAIAFSIGEDWSGNLNGYKKAVSIIIGNGFGSAFLDHGIPVVSGSTVPYKGTVYNLRYEDKLADDYFSSRGLVDTFIDKDRLVYKNIQALKKHAKINESAKNHFEDFGVRLGEFLHPIISKFDAEAVLFGGEVGADSALFESAFQNVLNDYKCTAKVLKANESSDPFICGAARLVDDNYWKKIEFVIPELD
ncbi:ROK family protein [Reichenbachiella sp.]|uniref:ROK family protein n=1 Tax=Reichenbachiella sp. TaxID=2184521 RepID=UPI003BB1368F